MYTPKEIAERWFTELWNEKNPNIIEELMSPDCKAHLEGGVETVGPAEFAAFYNSILEMLPDIKFELRRCLGDETDACIHWKMTATAAAGNIVAVRGSTWIHVEGGQVVEGWDCWNHGGFVHALGIEPEQQ